MASIGGGGVRQRRSVFRHLLTHASACTPDGVAFPPMPAAQIPCDEMVALLELEHLGGPWIELMQSKGHDRWW